MSWGVIAGGWGIMGEVWRKGPWTAEEDKLLIQYVRLHGEGRWNSLARLAGLKRNGKSCRLRWVNYLRPDLKRGHITPQEESIILELHARWGNRWSTIARSLPGRTDNEIKNYWRTRFRKKVKSSVGNHENQKTKLLIRRQQFQQQQQQQQQQKQLQMNQADMKTIMFLLDESENRVPYVAQVRQDHMVNMYTHTADQEQEFLYSILNGNVSEPEAWNEDIILWDGLWDLEDVHANFSAASATNKASLHSLVAPFC